MRDARRIETAALVAFPSRHRRHAIASHVPGAICWRVPSPTRTSRGIRNAVLPALALAATGCASPGNVAPNISEAIDTTRPSPVQQEPWWRETGDPILASLIEQGLAADSGIVCRMAALGQKGHAAAQSAKTLGASLQRLFAKQALAREEANREAHVLELVHRRTELAERIALSYVELRRLQQIRVMRANLLDQYRDNAEIAEFRRQAGLVPALDSALARTQDETARAELGYTDGRLEDALTYLAGLTGLEPGVLSARVGIVAPLPPALENAPAPPEAGDRPPDLTKTVDAARRTAKDMRSAYREGATGFTSLYVAEVAALSVEQALADARAQRAASVIRQWNARGNDWARADVDHATPPSPAIAAQSDAGGCD
ncbi:TolC family protein [Novosphingobium sp.]|uniref:TolC family protein n=1 Tax=Novosphingobium sp. TaxID=1874826 RepID=UPI002B488E70|nr:TolC family protein [Novosphingobium sp.]HKR91314.1 TolC family protein [Novosphingobium sp.]